MKPTTKILKERDKILFEKALKFYFFSRQQDVRKLNSELQERLQYSGQVAYSLIVTYMMENQLKLEYMDFLNMEIKTLLGVNPDFLKPLQVQPDEIDEIQLNEEINLQVFDEQEGRNIVLSYQPEHNRVSLLIPDVN